MNSSDTPSGKWTVFFLVATAVFMSTLDSSIVNIALPAIMKDLAVPMTTIEWVPLIYLLTISSLLLSAGRLSDIQGRRRVYCLGFVFFTIGSLFCGIAQNADWLIIARSVQGIGAAMLMACTSALVVDIFPITERGRALGMVGTVVATGLTVGPPVGGFLVSLFSWRYIFYINIPIGIVAAVWANKVLKGGKGDISRAESFDWTGSILIAVSFSTILLVANRISAWGLLSPKTGLLFSASVLTALMLLYIESRKENPIFDPVLLKHRPFALPLLSAVINFISLFIMIFLMPFYMVHPAGFPIDKAGYTMIIPFAYLLFVSPIAGWISDRIGSRLLCTAGMVVVSWGLFALSVLPAKPAYTAIVWPLSLVGIGFALFISPNSAAAMSAVPPQQRGIAAGMVATARNLGMVIGVSLSALAFNSQFERLSGGIPFITYGPDIESFFMPAFHFAMRLGGVTAAVGAVICFLRGAEPGRD